MKPGFDPSPRAVRCVSALAAILATGIVMSMLDGLAARYSGPAHFAGGRPIVVDRMATVSGTARTARATAHGIAAAKATAPAPAAAEAFAREAASCDACVAALGIGTRSQ